MSLHPAESPADLNRVVAPLRARRLRTPSLPRVAAHPSPVHRAIVAVDIEGSTLRTDVKKARLRTVMYDVLESALTGCGVAESHRDRPVDTGDGAYVLVHPVDEAPKSLLLSGFVAILTELLTEYDAAHPDQLRLRVAIHAGEVSYDSRGCFGEAIDLTFRLLDAPEVKQLFRCTPGPLMLVVSDHLYDSVIRHGYHGLEHSTFTPLARVRIAGRHHVGYVHAAAPS
ncbi:MAG TPA: hypothetical protein VFV67_30830 [Actinophytocola sp.]|uniref:hypothetical protein n=1 Tax=Actinophytocola sp. TaxID=1872138 RepID=UPI002DBA0325|nr:hypothetical protein [Actinophytocola sp.]HEU5475061.1 hypothetical protein [Actinophytocola sp.]